jgi:EAL domain-containing protein (putative c-di-GMP-specific phosphodiesterase class I)/ActR/RegA family two-component response regulator
VRPAAAAREASDHPAVPDDGNAAPPGLISVLVAEDDAGMRLALDALISSDPSLVLVASAADADQAIALAESHRPQVCVLDVSMPAGGGSRATRAIRSSVPCARIIALSGHEDRATVVEMLRAGAAAYLVKGGAPDELVEAIHAVASGRRVLSKAVTDGVVGELAEQLAHEEGEARRRRDALARIERVLDEELLRIVFQPVVELATERMIGVEALARFVVEPLRGPDVWFAEAAEVGLSLQLELAAVRAAVTALAHLPDDSFLAVNLSPAAAGSDDLLRTLDGVSAERLIVEITEHAPVEDYATLTRRLARLRALGVRLAIDDVGAGFASLRHILRLAPDIIKTDMTLTRNVESDRAERALTSALISFAAKIGATVVAEGIESDAEMRALVNLGVRYGQGYHLGRPAPLPDARTAHRRALAARRSSAVPR